MPRRRAGSALAALGTSPLPVEPTVSTKDRYQRMARRFGLTVAEELTCGCHVHVGVESDEEAVGALDRLRPWLAPLLAMTANSPFWQGTDSRYASYRSQVWSRWPSAGPYAPFGSPAAYHGTVAAMIASDTVLDRGMVYFDARLSAEHPTLEVRVADVCLDVDDAVLFAALVRALVETAAAQWGADAAPDPVRLELLRLAAWRASRSSVDGMLLDPGSWCPAPAADVLGRLVAHVTPALEEAGDLARVRELLADVLGRGTGARAQRAAGDPARGRGDGGAPDGCVTPAGPAQRAGAVSSAPRPRALRTASQTSPTAARPSTTYVTWPSQACTRSQCSPRYQPSPMNRAFHTALPIVVSRRKRGSGIRQMPAGIETRLRTTGTHRPSSTTLPPCRPKIRWPRSRSFWLVTKNQRRPARACSRS